MGRETEIAYCDSTCNPVVGCLGCELHGESTPERSHCYAAAMVRRYAGAPYWPRSFDRPEHFPGRIEAACRWPDLRGKPRVEKWWLDRFPRVVFVNDLSDSFGSVDPDIWLAPRLDEMGRSPHVWLLCTKRPAKMGAFFARHGGAPQNFWLVATVTSREKLWRARELREIPGAVRGLSLEPLVGPVVLGELARGLDWVIVGAESGRGARPMAAEWAVALREECRAAGVAFHLKQQCDREGRKLPEAMLGGVEYRGMPTWTR